MKTKDNWIVPWLLAFVYYGLKDIENAKKHIAIALATSKKDADLVCMNGLINKDKEEVKKAFGMNAYQDHVFVEEGKSYLK